jgi:CRISPR-associated protein Cas5d
MDYTDKEFCLEVWGDMACFTRPELKVERVSYDVITPSAARAIFEAIFWKPAIKWQVTKIEVLNPIKWSSIRRNEVGSVSKSSVYIEDKRQQKNTLLLRDVYYRLWAKLIFIPQRQRTWEKESKKTSIANGEADILRNNENPMKYYEMFERRAKKGQCFNQPYLGCREFSASFRLVDPEKEELKQPIIETKDLGIMLYDLDFDRNNQKPEAMFYHAKMNEGVITVPLKDSKEILR